MCGAPIVLNMLVHAPDGVKERFDHAVEVATGGAAPPSAVIAAMENMGFRRHPPLRPDRDLRPVAAVRLAGRMGRTGSRRARASRMARQGVAYHTLEGIMVADGETMEPVPWDGETIGELMIRSNTVMKGYLKNPDGHRARPCAAAGSTPAIWACATRTATWRSRTAPRTSSSPAARTSPAWRWRRCCTRTRRSWKRRWSRAPTRTGAKRCAPS